MLTILRVTRNYFIAEYSDNEFEMVLFKYLLSFDSSRTLIRLYVEAIF